MPSDPDLQELARIHDCKPNYKYVHAVGLKDGSKYHLLCVGVSEEGDFIMKFRWDHKGSKNHVTRHPSGVYNHYINGRQYRQEKRKPLSQVTEIESIGGSSVNKLDVGYWCDLEEKHENVLDSLNIDLDAYRFRFYGIYCYLVKPEFTTDFKNIDCEIEGVQRLLFTDSNPHIGIIFKPSPQNDEIIQ